MLRLIFFIFLFFVLGGFFIIAENNLYLSEKISRTEFITHYVSWLDNVFWNTKNLTSNVVHRIRIP
jgi:hypothetical protein